MIFTLRNSNILSALPLLKFVDPYHILLYSFDIPYGYISLISHSGHSESFPKSFFKLVSFIPQSNLSLEATFKVSFHLCMYMCLD